VSAPLQVPLPAPHVIAHASARGTQNYECATTTGDAGASYAWRFTGPSAKLFDCNGAPYGEHSASDGGPTAPVWRAADGSFVIGQKVAAESPNGAPIPWLRVKAVASGGCLPITGV